MRNGNDGEKRRDSQPKKIKAQRNGEIGEQRKEGANRVEGRGLQRELTAAVLLIVRERQKNAVKSTRVQYRDRDNEEARERNVIRADRVVRVSRNDKLYM